MSKRLWRLYVIVGGLVMAGCGTITGGNDEASDALQAAEARWSRQGVSDYQVVVRYLCFCAYTRPVRLTVRFGNVISRVDAETGEPVPAFGQHVRDIAGLFDLIRDAIQRDAHKVDVTYDRTYGYPTRIDLDYLVNAADDELEVTVSQFQPQR
jgi:hypothetical protein